MSHVTSDIILHPFWINRFNLNKMDLTKYIQEVQVASDAVSSGDKEGHARLLRAIRKLNDATETPTETLMRISYQARSHQIPQRQRTADD